MTPLSDISNNWCYWTIFALGLVWAVSYAVPFCATILHSLFRWGVMALTVCDALKGAGRLTYFTSAQWGWVVLILVGIIAVKNAVDWYIQTTFQFHIHYPTMRQQRTNIWQVISWLLFLYLLVEPWLNDTARWIIPCVLFCAYIILWGWKILISFGLTLKHVCLIVLYLLHTDILATLIVCGSSYTVLNATEYII